jgi:predicted RNA-binding Zn-ribbon protein involved in translation (DUF1610 family)
MNTVPEGQSVVQSPKRRSLSNQEVEAAAACPVCGGRLTQRLLPTRDHKLLRQAVCYECGSTGQSELEQPTT